MTARRNRTHRLLKLGHEFWRQFSDASRPGEQATNEQSAFAREPLGSMIAQEQQIMPIDRAGEALVGCAGEQLMPPISAPEGQRETGMHSITRTGRNGAT